MIKHYGGRTELLTPLKPTDRTAIAKILTNVLPVHYTNAREITELYEMYTGKHPILNRVKDIRPEINNKIVDNVCYEIAEFTIGYRAGEPIQYVKRGKEDDTHNDLTSITKLNDLMIDVNREPKDRELIEWLTVVGVGHKLGITSDEILDDDEDIDFTVPDPRNAFVVKDTIRKRPVLGVIIGEHVDEGKKTIQVWTNDKVYNGEMSDGGVDVLLEGGKDNPFETIPLFEYQNNPSMMGVFEPILPLQDAINELSSSRVDNVQQIVQSIMVFINSDIDKDKFQELMAVGGLAIMGEPGLPADVKIVGTTLDEDGSQTHADHLYQRALTIAGIPDRNASAGGNTGTAMEIGQGWINAENRTRTFESMWIQSERKFLKWVIGVLKSLKSDDYKPLEVNDIEIKFTRNKLANMMVKSQAMLNLLQGGIHPKIAIASSMLFNDPEQTYMESERDGYLEKWKIDGPSVPTAAGKTPPLTNARAKGLHSVQDNFTKETDTHEAPKPNQVREVGKY